MFYQIGDKRLCQMCDTYIEIVDFDEAEGAPLWSHVQTSNCDDPVPLPLNCSSCYGKPKGQCPDCGTVEEKSRWFARNLKESEQRKQINAYFDSLHSTTWGRGFTITDKEGRKEAVAFVLRLLNELERY